MQKIVTLPTKLDMFRLGEIFSGFNRDKFVVQKFANESDKIRVVVTPKMGSRLAVEYDKGYLKRITIGNMEFCDPNVCRYNKVFVDDVAEVIDVISSSAAFYLGSHLEV